MTASRHPGILVVNSPKRSEPESVALEPAWGEGGVGRCMMELVWNGGRWLVKRDFQVGRLSVRILLWATRLASSYVHR